MSRDYFEQHLMPVRTGAVTDMEAAAVRSYLDAFGQIERWFDNFDALARHHHRMGYGCYFDDGRPRVDAHPEGLTYFSTGKGMWLVTWDRVKAVLPELYSPVQLALFDLIGVA